MFLFLSMSLDKVSKSKSLTVGLVESIVGKNSVKVSVHGFKKAFGKTINVKFFLVCHAPDGIDVLVGDKVLFTQSKPISKTKAHVIVGKG